MASFCSGCGFPQGPNVTFCPNCGARQQAAASSAPLLPQSAPQPVPVVAAPRAGMSTGMKVLLTLVVLFMLAGVAGIAGVIYVGHRVKEAVVDKAKAYGVELPTEPGRHASSTPVHLPQPCDLLSKQEVSTLLGEPIERSETSQEGCLYYGPAGLSETLAKTQFSSTMQSAQTPGSNVGASEVATSVEQMVGSMPGAQGMTGNGGESPLLMLMIDPDGKAQMTALTASKALFNGIFKAADAKGLSMGGEISGLGDRALRMPKLGLNVLKGEVLVRIIPGPVPDADAKTIAVARAVLGKF
jgi:hypothetical protein